jgi:hypothetical protein
VHNQKTHSGRLTFAGTVFKDIEDKINCMPQKHHEQAASHHEEAAKHHRTAAKHASEGNYEKAASHAQAAHGHQQKAKEHAGKASEKYAEKVGSMKKEGKEKEMHESSNGR